MNSLRNIAGALLLALLLVSVALTEGGKGKEKTDIQQNQDGTWTGTTTHGDGSKTVTDEDKDHHTTKVTEFDAKGKKIKECDWVWDDEKKKNFVQKCHIYPHDKTLESETEYDENGVKLKETVKEEGYDIVDTYAGGKRVKREKIVGGKVVKTEHFDKDGKLIQHSIAQPSPSDVITPSGAQDQATTQLIGIVYDKDSRPGDQISATATTDPAKYRNIPTLGVVEMPVPRGTNGQATLEGVVVDLGDGRKQPATGLLGLAVGQAATAIPITITLQGSGARAAQAQVPLAQGPSPITVRDSGKASDFNTPPVVRDVSVIHGPLSGNTQAIHMTLDDQPVTILAATPRSAVFELPPNTTPGTHTLILRDGNRSASASLVKTALTMQAGQSQLLKGQSTNYTATVLLGPLPDSVWQNGGSSLDRVSPIQANQFPSHFRAPQQGEPAAVLLRIENASHDTITLKPSKNEVITRVLHQQDFKENQYNESGTIQSKRSGGFVINGTVQTFFAPISCSEVTQAAAAKGAAEALAPANEKLKEKNEAGPNTETDMSAAPNRAEPTSAGNNLLQGGTLLSTQFKGKGGDGLKDSYTRGFTDSNIDICKQQTCGDPQEITQKEKGKLIHCKKDDACGGKQCPKTSCHVFWAWIDGTKGPGGKDRKDAKEANEKWSLFGQDPNGIGDKNGIGKENAITRDPDHAYACVCK